MPACPSFVISVVRDVVILYVAMVCCLFLYVLVRYLVSCSVRSFVVSSFSCFVM